MLYRYNPLTYNAGTMKCLRHTIVFISLLLAFLTFGAFAPASAQSILKSADEYRKSLVRFERQNKSTRQPVSLESILRRGKAVADKLEDLEFLNESDYDQVKKSMRGYFINREEVVFIRPMPDFFLSLARRRGSQADIEFFSLLRQIRPDAVWPVYVEQWNDYSGCTKYGSGLLTDLYGRIIRYQRRFPQAYKKEIANEKQEIEEAFTSEPCSCGDKASVVREFSLFVRRYPRDPNTSQIERSLPEIKKRVNFRDNCRPQ